MRGKNMKAGANVRTFAKLFEAGKMHNAVGTKDAPDTSADGALALRDAKVAAKGSEALLPVFGSIQSPEDFLRAQAEEEALSMALIQQLLAQEDQQYNSPRRTR